MTLKFLKRNTYPLLATISLTGIVTSSYYYYYIHRNTAANKRTFDLPVHMRDSTTGKRYTEMRKIPLMGEQEVERRLRQFASHGGVVTCGGDRGDGGGGGDGDSRTWRWSWDTAQVAANSPVEDAWGSVVVARDPRTSDAGLAPRTEPEANMKSTPINTDTDTSGNLLFFTVLDGHRGPHTSRLLSKILIPAVGLELSYLMNQLISPGQQHYPLPDSERKVTTVAAAAADQNPLYVSLAIQSAFAKLDAELMSAPIRLMNAALTKSVSKLKSESQSESFADPDPTLAPGPTSDYRDESVQTLRADSLARSAVKAAISGSCALLALLDTGTRNLYVACTGDSRAVAGYFDGERGTWSVEVLSDDQTGRNESEMRRIQSEHPPEESATVIQRGRILGGLEPSRAFGDARYKWPRELQDRISRIFFSETDELPRRPPADLHTPPYVTAQPVVTYRTGFIPPAPPTSPSSSSKSKSKLEAPASNSMRFLILATDGLWDMISSKDACALVAGHLSGMRGTVPKKELIDRLGLSVAAGAEGVEGKDKTKQAEKANDTAGEETGSWVFKEENLATHLVRNALGGGDDIRLREIMSIPPPLARRYRDDTTVTVVWWEEGKEHEKVEVKAKL